MKITVPTKSRLTILAGLGVGALALSACGGGQAASPGAAAEGGLADMAPITLTIADFDPEGATHTEPIANWAKAVEERTDGKVTFEAYYSASLIPANEMLTGIGTGVADVGRIVGSYYPQELPISNWMMQLGSTSDASYPHGMLQGSATSFETVMGSEEIQAEFAAHNLVPLLAINPSQQYDFLCTEGFSTPEEAAGLRARTLGEIWVNEVSAAGLEPVPLGINEVYEALQRGVIECATAPVNSHIDNGFWEIAHDFVPVKMSQLNSLQLTINKDVWQGLPAEVQDIMREEAVNAWGAMLKRQMANYKIFGTEGVEEHDIVVHDPRALDAVLEAYQKDVVAGLAAKAPSTLSDPEGFIEGYLATQQKWLDFIVEEMDLPLNERDPETILDTYRTQSDVDLSVLLDAVAGD
jgi:TRAP-type C4-dicarboxylate transport system, periplasmic component